jgi:hypothetical protein
MVHCHNLPHEDHDMMTQFSVVAVDFSKDPHHPIEADRPARTAVPGAPVIRTATAANASALVRWSVPDDNGGAILGYRVRVVNASNQQVGALREASARATSLSVTGLVNGSKYKLLVQARNLKGAGAFSSKSREVIPVTVAGSPVIGVASAGVAGGAINATARWTPPALTGGSAITGYAVTAWQINSRGRFVRQIQSRVQPPSTRKLTMTLPRGNYKFVVQARNALGHGATSAKSRLVTAR